MCYSIYCGKTVIFRRPHGISKAPKAPFYVQTRIKCRMYKVLCTWKFSARAACGPHAGQRRGTFLCPIFQRRRSGNDGKTACRGRLSFHHFRTFSFEKSGRGMFLSAARRAARTPPWRKTSKCIALCTCGTLCGSAHKKVLSVPY